MITLLIRWGLWPARPTLEPREWSGPQCFDSAAGTTMVAIHIAEATPHRRLG